MIKQKKSSQWSKWKKNRGGMFPNSQSQEGKSERRLSNLATLHIVQKLRMFLPYIQLCL
jgi:hypothetical protein